jgi:hypothetical protein
MVRTGSVRRGREIGLLYRWQVAGGPTQPGFPTHRATKSARGAKAQVLPSHALKLPRHRKDGHGTVSTL